MHFFGGFFTATVIFCIILVACFAPTSFEISKEIVNNVQQSTNIVETLKKEHLVIRDVKLGTEADTAEIIVEYNFLYKNSKKR